MSVRAAQSCFWRRAKTTRCSTLNHGERELGADDKVDMVAGKYRLGSHCSRRSLACRDRLLLGTT